MSGAEADISSDGETSFEDEDVPLPPSPLKEGTDEPFKVVLKGGSPWGFTITSGKESKASVLINEVFLYTCIWLFFLPEDFACQITDLISQAIFLCDRVFYWLIARADRSVFILKSIYQL